MRKLFGLLLIVLLASAAHAQHAITITPQPLPPSAVPPGYVLTFDDEFTSLTDISTSAIPYARGINWYNGIVQCCMSPSATGQHGVMYPTHLWNCTTFQDIGPLNPYAIDPNGGGLDINLTLTDCIWNSGVMQTVGTDGKGFSQQYGYFEIAVQFPPGPGTWPGFWMLPVNRTANHGEIDILEQYGQFRNQYCANLHDWDNANNTAGRCVTVPFDKSLQYHVYGMLWTPTAVTFYADGQQVWQHAPLSVMGGPYYLLVDLGIGGGWPTDHTPNPSTMRIKYIRAYRAP